MWFSIKTNWKILQELFKKLNRRTALCAQPHNNSGQYKASKSKNNNIHYDNYDDFDNSPELCLNATVESKACPGRQILINGEITPEKYKSIPVQLLVDSGSTICMIRNNIVKRLSKFNLHPRKIDKLSVKGVGNNLPNIDEEIELPITISNGKQSISFIHPFLVINNPVPFDCLLGNDLLHKILDKINYRSKTVDFITTFKSASIPPYKTMSIPLVQEKQKFQSYATSISLFVKEIYKNHLPSPLQQLWTDGFIKLV